MSKGLTAWGTLAGLAGVAIIIFSFNYGKKPKKEGLVVEDTTPQIEPIQSANEEVSSMINEELPPPAPDVVAIKLNKGETVYARFNRIGVYTRPLRKVKYLKNPFHLFKKFDEIGIYNEESVEPGWSKVYVPKFKDNPYLFVQSQNLTNIKTL